MNQDDCPLAARGILTASCSTPSCINSHRTISALDSRLWIATPVLIPASWRRTGKTASLTGELAPTPATPMSGQVKAQDPADGPERDHPHRSAHQLPLAVGRNREFSQRLHRRLDAQAAVLLGSPDRP